MGVGLVETLLADLLETEGPHHGVEEDLEEIHVISVMLLHDLHPLDSDGVLDAVLLSSEDGQFSHFLE